MASATETFDFTELVGLFREALIALLPVMEKSRIKWREGQSYDPWEEIERTPYHSIIGSCVDNAMSIQPIVRLASYGLERQAYADRSFLVASDNEHIAFLKFGTSSEPFDEAIFLELGTALKPSGSRVRRGLAGTQFLLACLKTIIGWSYTGKSNISLRERFPLS
jgi:hypothetical protein